MGGVSGTAATAATHSAPAKKSRAASAETIGCRIARRPPPVDTSDQSHSGSLAWSPPPIWERPSTIVGGSRSSSGGSLRTAWSRTTASSALKNMEPAPKKGV